MTGVIGYDIYRSITANQPIATMEKLTDTPTTAAIGVDSSLSSNTTYYYKVVANNSSGAGAPSSEVSAITRPSAPTGIVAAASGSAQITVSWATMIGVSSYDVYRSTTAGQSLSLMARLTSGTGTTSNAFVDTGLTNATNYYYKVVANNAAGAGDASIEASAVTNSTASGVYAQANSATQISLSWSSVTGDIGFDVYRSEAAGQNIAVMSHLNTAGLLTNPSYTDSGRNPNTTYYYKVVTTNGSGAGAPSVEVSATTPLLLMGGTMQGQDLAIGGNVSTYAGSGTAGSVNGDVTGGPNAVTFNNPHSITSDGKALYVADYLSNKIRKIDLSTNVVTTFAGSGVASSINGIGVAATFNRPLGITTDGISLYVAEYNGNKIRKINLASAQVSTVAGTGVAGFLDGAATTAKFNLPFGVTTDGINLYVADGANHRIRQIRLTDGNVTTLAGSTIGWADGTGVAAKFNNPTGVTTDGTNVYVTDLNNHRIRRIVITTGVVTTVAGSGVAGSLDGTGTASSFKQPYGITTDGINLYVADYGNHKIRKIVIASMAVTTLAGTGGAGNLDGAGTVAMFNNPVSVTTDGTSLYVSDHLNNKIRKIQ
jgi:sugar lactone lactonase YvrE/fibronectin type 3 domain-containing protein